MAAKGLNKKNLVELGADALADLLLDVIKGDAERQRRVRLVLSADKSPSDAADAIRKRFASLRRATGFISWQSQRKLANELNDLIQVIDERIAPEQPNLAFDLLWSLLGLSPSIQERTDDSNGTIGSVMDYAKTKIQAVAPQLTLNKEVLADQVFEALLDNGYGEYDGIIRDLTEALGEDGLNHLKSKAIAALNSPLTKAEISQYEGWYGHNRSAEEIAIGSRKSSMDIILRDVADGLGDVDGWLSQYTPEQLTFHTIAPNAAQRLLAAGRAEDALQVIRNCITETNKRDRWFDMPQLDRAHFECLKALNLTDELKAALWDRFERELCTDALRQYLKMLPDFEDEEDLHKAETRVLNHPSVYKALTFCLDWPNLGLADQLVRSRHDEFDGNVYQILNGAAEKLGQNYPLAAVTLWRSMIDFTLEEARSTRYGHAARHLKSCEAADGDIDDYEGQLTHEAYLAKLKVRHGRKSGFWGRVEI